MQSPFADVFEKAPTKHTHANPQPIIQVITRLPSTVALPHSLRLSTSPAGRPDRLHLLQQRRHCTTGPAAPLHVLGQRGRKWPVPSSADVSNNGISSASIQPTWILVGVVESDPQETGPLTPRVPGTSGVVINRKVVPRQWRQRRRRTTTPAPRSRACPHPPEQRSILSARTTVTQPSCGS